MDWFTIISLIILIFAIINILIMALNQQNFFFQVLYAFIYEHEIWKRYRKLKKYLKTNTIPLINIIDYIENNVGFTFVQYDNEVFVISGDNIYLNSYFIRLIENLLKHNNHNS